MHENTCMDCMVLGHEMVSVGKEDKSPSTTQLPVVSLYRVMVTMLSWDDPESLIVGFECCWPCTSSRVMELVMALAEELWQQNSSMFSKKKDRWKNSKKQCKMTEWLCHSFWTFYCTNQYDDHNPWWSNSRQSSVARRCLRLLNDDFNKSFSVNIDRLHVNHRNRPPIAYTSSVNSRIFCGSWFLTFLLSDSIWLLDGLSNRDLMSAIFLRVTSVQNFKSNSSR